MIKKLFFAFFCEWNGIYYVVLDANFFTPIDDNHKGKKNKY